MKKISVIILSILFSILLSITLSLPVMALDLDVIEDEKKEDIKDDFKEEKKSNNSLRQTINDPLQADQIAYIYSPTSRRYYYTTWRVPIGTKYVIQTGSMSEPYNMYLFPEAGYFVRGEEVLYERLYMSTVPYGGTSELSDCYMSLFVVNEGQSNTCYIYSVDDYYNNLPEPTPEPTPTPDEPTISDNIVSWNSVSENLISIEKEIRGLRKDVQNLANVTFFVSISNNNVSDNQIITLSDDIIHKPIKEYSTAESISLIGLMLAFTGLIVYVVHKSIYRWRR